MWEEARRTAQTSSGSGACVRRSYSGAPPAISLDPPSPRPVPLRCHRSPVAHPPLPHRRWLPRLWLLFGAQALPQPVRDRVPSLKRSPVTAAAPPCLIRKATEQRVRRVEARCRQQALRRCGRRRTWRRRMTGFKLSTRVVFGSSLMRCCIRRIQSRNIYDLWCPNSLEAC